MAEQAQKEPSMEEILSSIRKIIADDDAPEAVVSESENAIDADDASVFEDDDIGTPDTAIETEEDVLAAISQSMHEATAELEADPGVEEPVEVEEDSFDFLVDDDDFENFEETDFEGVDDFAEAEVEAVEDSFEPAVESVPDLQPEPELDIEEEMPMSASAAPLTDTATVSAAAGSLGKLLSNVEFGEEAGGATTIDALVREMLRPMLKEWLDDNLPGIVEKQVEAEVQRIARMAG